LDEGEASGVEQGRTRIKLLVEVLRFDKGMPTAMGTNHLTDMGVIRGMNATDLPRSDHENALTAIACLSPASNTKLTRKKGITGPDGAGEEAGRVSGGGHGDKFTVVTSGKDVLGFVDNEKQGGGIANDVGAGIAGEE